MRPNTTHVLVGVLCVGLLASASGATLAPSPAADLQETQQSEPGDWPDTCDDARVIDAGTYNGTLSPADTDAFIIESVGEGNYAALNFSYQGGAEEIDVTTQTESDEFSTAIFTAGTGESLEDVYDNAALFSDGQRASLDAQAEDDSSLYSMRVYAEDDNPICIQFETDATTAASWRLSMAPRAAAAPPITCPPPETAD